MFTPRDFSWNEQFPEQGDETPKAIKQGNQRKYVSLVIVGFVTQAVIVLCVASLALRFAPAFREALVYLTSLVN